MMLVFGEIVKVGREEICFYFLPVTLSDGNCRQIGDCFAMAEELEVKGRLVKSCGRIARAGGAFTLIELMAVVLVILVLAAIGMGVAGFVQKKMASSAARSQIAAIEAALNSYKLDWGFYPVSSTFRNSYLGTAEASNNWLMYRAISGTCTGCSKAYLGFSTLQVRSNVMIGVVSGTKTGLALNVYDPWGKPYLYYNSPRTAFATGSAGGAGYTVGGQVNVTAFDLYSYGADGCTYIPGIIFTNWNSPVWSTNWVKRESINDDITNWH